MIARRLVQVPAAVVPHAAAAGFKGPIGFDGLVRQWCSSGWRPTAPARMGKSKCEHDPFVQGEVAQGAGRSPAVALAVVRPCPRVAGTNARDRAETTAFDCLRASVATLTRAVKDGALVEGTCPQKAGRRRFCTARSDAGSIPAGSIALIACTTAAVVAPAVALSFDLEALLRYFAALIGCFAVLVLLAPSADAGRPSRSTAVASAYSRETSGPTNGCDGSQLYDSALSVATFLVPCGVRIRICYGRRCVVAVRKDSGPFAPGRQIDLNLGVVRRLGFPSCAAWGVRTVTWSRA